MRPSRMLSVLFCHPFMHLLSISYAMPVRKIIHHPKANHVNYPLQLAEGVMHVSCYKFDMSLWSGKDIIPWANFLAAFHAVAT